MGLLLGSIAGCSGSDAPVREYADVSGKITYMGEPLTKGKVMFQPPEGEAVVAELQGDGTYTMKGVVGPNDVSVVSQDEWGETDANNPASRQEPKSYIPTKYAAPTSSGLKYDVKSGTNTDANFDLQNY